MVAGNIVVVINDRGHLNAYRVSPAARDTPSPPPRRSRKLAAAPQPAPTAAPDARAGTPRVYACARHRRRRRQDRATAPRADR